jgi:hypothetical protein
MPPRPSSPRPSTSGIHGLTAGLRAQTAGLRAPPYTEKERTMKNEKVVATKKTGTLRPWLVDVTIEHLR